MKTLLNRTPFLLISVALLAAQPVRLLAAAYDVSTSQKNTTDNAWKNVIFSPVASGVWTFDSSKNPTSTATTGTGSIARAIGPTFEAPVLGAAIGTSLTLSGGFAVSGTSTQLGPGGAGLDNSVLLLAGSDASSYGAQIRFVRNVTNLWSLGHYSSIQGGTSDDLLLYNQIAGGEMLRFTSSGFSATLGPGGVGTNNAILTLSGSSASSYGAYLNLARGGTNKWVIGHYSGIQGGALDDLLIYNPTAANEALRIAAATSAVTLAGNFAIGGTSAIKGVRTATATLDFPSISAASQQSLTVTVTGAAVGDVVQLGLPASPTANIVFFGFVSAADTVTIRASNITAGAIDPASDTYRVAVTSF
jgi:hypothetical protein